MARTTTRAKMSPKKKIAVATSLVLIAALLLGGAYAWIDFSQSFINRFRGGVTPDILLHDDFEPWVNKDVYVENPGEQDMYVRVQFKEFLQIGNNILVGGNPNAKETWEIHNFFDGTNWVDIALDGEAVDGCELETHDYFTWYLGGEKIYLRGTSEQGNEDWSAHTPDSENDVGPNGQTFGETLEALNIITIDDWTGAADAAAKAAFGACWILDKDGWCYWSQPLPGGEATSLLLDNVLKTTMPDDNFAYFIDVALQASNKTELRKFLDTNDITDEAKTIWEIPVADGIILSLVESGSAEGAATISNVSGSQLQLYSAVTGTENVPQTVYWSILGAAPAGVSIDQNGLVTLSADVTDGTEFTIQVQSLYNQSEDCTATIKLTASSAAG